MKKLMISSLSLFILLAACNKDNKDTNEEIIDDNIADSYWGGYWSEESKLPILVFLGEDGTLKVWDNINHPRDTTQEYLPKGSGTWLERQDSIIGVYRYETDIINTYLDMKFNKTKKVLEGAWNWETYDYSTGGYNFIQVTKLP